MVSETLCASHHQNADACEQPVTARLRESATTPDVEGMSTDQVMELLRGE